LCNASLANIVAIMFHELEVAWLQVPLSRRVIKQGLSKLCKVEVYLVDLKLCHVKDLRQPVVRYFSHVDTLGKTLSYFQVTV